MFRRTSSCHQDFTTPPPPPCGSEGQKATVCCPVVVQLLPTTRPHATQPPATHRERPDRGAPGDRPSVLLPQAGGSAGGRVWIQSAGPPGFGVRERERRILAPRSLPDFLTQQVAVLKKSQSQPGFDLVRVDSDARGIFAVS